MERYMSRVQVGLISHDKSTKQSIEAITQRAAADSTVDGTASIIKSNEGNPSTAHLGQ